MSDEQSKGGKEEINQVLESIRRLVSDKSQQAGVSPLQLTPEHKIAEVPRDDGGKPAPLVLSPVQIEPEGEDAPKDAEVVKLDFTDPTETPTTPLRLVETSSDEVSVDGSLFSGTSEEPDEMPAGDAAAAGNAPSDDSGSADDASGGFFDEEVLRTMVADIVREELDGQLGDRITRNVRKMVRREVLRAMDFDGDDGKLGD